MIVKEMDETLKIERSTPEHTQILSFLKDFYQASQIFYLYPSQHPKVAQAIEILHDSYNTLMSNKEAFIISTIKKDLLFNALPLDFPSNDVRAFATLLYDNRIASITFLGQIDRESLKRLMEIFSQKSKQRQSDDNLIEMINAAGIQQVKLERINYKEIFSQKHGESPSEIIENTAPVSSSLVEYLKGKAEKQIRYGGGSGSDSEGGGSFSEEGALNEEDDEAACEMARQPGSLNRFIQTMAEHSDAPVDELVEMVERLGIYLEKYHQEDSNMYLKNLAEVVSSIDSELRMDILGHALERCSRARGSGGTSMQQFVKKMTETITLALIDENQSSSINMLKIFKIFSQFPDIAQDLNPEVKKTLQNSASLSGESFKLFNKLFVKNQGTSQSTSNYLEHIVNALEKNSNLNPSPDEVKKIDRYTKMVTNKALLLQSCRLQIEIIKFTEKQDTRDSVKNALKETITRLYHDDNKENILTIFEYFTSEKALFECFLKEIKGTEIIENILIDFTTFTPLIREKFAARLCRFRNITLYFLMNVLIKIDNDDQKLSLLQSLAAYDVINSKSFSYLEPHLKDEKISVIKNVIMIFGVIQDSGAVNNLIKALDHDVPEIVETAIKALGKAGTTGAAESLLSFLKNSDESFVPHIINALLAAPDEKKVISILNTFFSRKSLSSTCMELTIPRLLYAIGQCRVESALPFISDINKNKQNIFQSLESVNYIISETLKALNTPQAHKLLLKIEKENSRLHQSSQGILEKMWKGLFKSS